MTGQKRFDGVSFLPDGVIMREITPEQALEEEKASF
jgi:hypothetical protein